MTPMDTAAAWPAGACFVDGTRWVVDISEWPVVPGGRIHLGSLLQEYGSRPLPQRATRGFRDRLSRSSLRYDEQFMRDLDSHVVAME
jgi:DNA (cytosine-5)-methyltransferase 1